MRAVIFDMDGVLCRYDRVDRIRQMAEALDVDAELIEAEMFESGYEDAADRGEMTSDEYLEGLSERFGAGVTREIWVEARRGAMTPDDDVLDLVRRAAERAEVAMFTNNGFLTAETFDETFPEAAKLFGDRAFFSARLGAGKDTPDGFGRLLSELDWVAEETLLIDDKESYCEAAREAGLQTHLFASADQLADELETRGLI